MSTKMKPDGVSEMGGVLAGQADPQRWVEVRQVGKGLAITVNMSSATMSVPAARSLARQLYRLARRQELRDAT